MYTEGIRKGAFFYAAAIERNSESYDMSYQSYLIQAPVSDNTFTSPSVAQYWERCYFAITFYSDEYITPVVPSAGTATVEVTDDLFNYGTIPNGTIDVTAVGYDRPNVSGRVAKFRATLSGVTGATHFKLVAHEYN